MIGERQKTTIFPVVFSIAVVLLLAWHVSISTDYPYYFIWDMDHISCLDTILIQSGLLPDHVCHPSFGMYLFHFFSEKIAYLSGVISVLDIDDLSCSLNPLAAMAELTDFVRLHSPFLSVGIALFLCLVIQAIFRISRWWLLFFLVFLGVQESLAYHSSMIRTEFYSVFYWSGAVLMMTAAVKTDSSVKRYAALLGTGLLLGLSFLTKIQSLFYLAAVPVLLLVFSLFQDSPKQNHRNLKREGAFWVLAVSLFNVIAFLVLGVTSYSTPIPRGVSAWAEGFGITPIAFLFFSALLLLFLFQLFLYIAKKTSSDVFRFSCFFSVIAAGFMLSFAFYFLLYSDAALSLQYILLNFKIAFLRIPKPSALKIPESSAYISNFLPYLYHNPFVFIVHIGLSMLLVFGYCFRFVRITKGQLAFCLLLSIIAFVNIVVATRPILRDILWKEMLLNFLNLFYFAILVNRAEKYHLGLTRAGFGLLIVLFFVNCINAHNVPDRLDAEANHYGWQVSKFFGGVYGGNQRKYSEIMRRKYNNTTALVAKDEAVNHARIRRTVNFVFKNQTVTHRNIGIVFEGFSAWTADSDYKIAEVPPILKGAILVDNAGVELEDKTCFEEERVGKKLRYPYKFKRPCPSGRVSVLPRSDLSIFLFAYSDDVSSLVSEEIVQTPYKITLRNSKQTVELYGLEVKSYCEIPLDKFLRKFFFVIREV